MPHIVLQKMIYLNELRVYFLTAYIQLFIQAGLQFLNRIRLSSNSLICALFNSVHFSKCKLKEEWDTILRK